MNKQTNIIVNLQVEALHFWKDAKKHAPDVAFLSHPHRHIFHICAKKAVSHSDRDVEIILFKRELSCYFERNYFDGELAVCNFQGKSCEMICEDLMEAYDLDYVSVLEDNENGAEMFKK